MTTIAYRFLVRGGTAAAVAALNEVPLKRELIFETDTSKFKLGNGVTQYNSLPYAGYLQWQPLNANLSDISALADPNADRILFWDDSEGTSGGFAYLTIGSGLTITGTTLSSSSSGGALTLVGTATVAGAAATTITMSSLDLATDGRYLIEYSFLNATGSATSLSLFYNADTTATNYYTQFAGATGASLSAARANNAIFAGMNASSWQNGTVWIRPDLSGRPRSNFLINRHDASAIETLYSGAIRNNVANVTSVTFSSSVASAFAIGSFFKLWKQN